MIERSIAPFALRILNDYEKIVFLSGPRQVGKTTAARAIADIFGQSIYFNWDIITDQKRLQKDPYFFENENRDSHRPFLVILDEIHKYARWKNYLKGAYDKDAKEFRFLVTGSGRLDHFKRGGDSLLGRYMGLPLFPFSVGELLKGRSDWNEFKRLIDDPPPTATGANDCYRTLWKFSGFPEPFVRGKEPFYNAWFQERKVNLIRDDIRNTSNIREISLLEMLSHMIPDRVGSPLSINSLKEDLGVAFETVRDWLLLLERFYYLFRITPFAGSLARSLKKEGKVYLYDWVEVPQEGARFENMIALHLWKAVHLWRAVGAGRIDLHYVRDKEKREADFLVTEGEKPVCLIECKISDDNIAPALLYFQQKLRVPTAIQLIHQPGVCRKMSHNGFRQWIISADRWLNILP